MADNLVLSNTLLVILIIIILTEIVIRTTFIGSTFITRVRPVHLINVDYTGPSGRPPLDQNII